MGAAFAAVIRAPMTSVLIIFEMTRSYGLILPLMIANSMAFILARSMHRLPIYEALLEQDGRHLPSTHRTAAAISALTVADAMATNVTTLIDTMTVSEAAEVIKAHPYTKYPVIDDHGYLMGVVTESRLRRRIAENRGHEAVGTFARVEKFLEAEHPLVDAFVLMHKLGAHQMVVVDTRDGVRVVGVLAMSDVMRAHARAALADGDDPIAAAGRRVVTDAAETTRDSLSVPPPLQDATRRDSEKPN